MPSRPQPAADRPPRASIVIPTWNGERELAVLLPALERQEFEGGWELCAVDSSSTDGTRELLRAAGARVRTIDQRDFRHGATRNLGATDARGELIVFLSQDVLPEGDHFLEQLLAPFADPRVAGSYSRVLPAPGDDPLAARTVLDLPEASEQAWVRDLDEVGAVWDLEPIERGRYLRFNNVASAIRASVFSEIPFPDMRFAEDFAWAARALTAGWRVAYAPESVVYHAHRYDLGTAYARYRTDATFHREVHGWRMRPTLLSALRGFLYEVREDARYLAGDGGSGGWSPLLRSPGLRAAQVLGQYVGSRA